MARPSTSYEPRDPGSRILHQIVQDHLETFLAQAARLRDGAGLPPFVERAFRDFLRCGFLAGGFARFRCDGCALDRLVAFSCKGRALCPSCGGRRMAERAAHLVDGVIPDVPVRQWVLSLPHRLRYRLAWDHDLCRRVTTVFLGSVFRLLRDHARAVGLEQPRGGAVAIIQRFGGALNLNVHIHALVLDGVFARDAAGGLAFHPARRVSTLDVAEVLAAVEPRIRRLFEGGGRREDDHGGHAEDGGVDPWVDEAPVLAGLAAASVQGFVALGEHPGTGLQRCGHARVLVDRRLGPGHARWNGYDLHAGQWRYDPPAAAPISFVVSFSFSPTGTSAAQGGLAMSGGRGGGAASSMQAGGPVRVGSNSATPRKIVHVDPVYPEVALKAKVRGVVVAEIRIGTDGSVEDAKILRSIPLLDQAALDAVRQWRFTPTLLNGQAVPVIFTVTVNFNPERAGRQPVAAPVEQAVEVTPGPKPPRVIKDVKPRYPEEGLEAKVSGTVEVAVTIGTDGKVSAARIVRGIPMFEQAALDAAYQWEFEPVGQPVEVNIEFHFAARANR